ncbi:MAG: methyltransferase family protein [Terriglobales bacterium]
MPLALWWRLRPSRRETGAGLLASGWALFATALAGLAATYFGFAALSAPLLLGTPPDLLLSRVLLGGFCTALCFPSVPILRLCGFAIAFDLTFCTVAGGVNDLRSLAVQALIVALYFIPAQLFARWTRESRNLPVRASLHIIFHAGLLLGVLPALIVTCSGGNWNAPFARSSLMNKLYLQLLMVPAVVLISSVQEFARRGRGTPAPADPPHRLVTSGTYAYVANPMQVGKVLVVAGWGFFWWHPWMFVAALGGLLYSIGVASPREDTEMAQRFSTVWICYRQQVRRWWPRWKPYVDCSEDSSVAQIRGARLYLRLECEPCSQLARWLRQRTIGLLVLPIAEHRGRITYDPGNGSMVEHGVVALARALEHVNLAWALFGGILRLPGIAWLAQLVADSLDPQDESNCALPETTTAA